MCDSINRGNYPEESLLVGAAESVWKGSDARVNISIDVGQRLADTIGEEIEGQLECVFITDSDIRHIRRKHGANEERRGQQSIVPNDSSRKFSTSPTHAITRTDKAGNKKSLVRKEIGAPPTW